MYNNVISIIQDWSLRFVTIGILQLLATTYLQFDQRLHSYIKHNNYE